MSLLIPKKETDVYARTGDKGLILGPSSPIVFEMNQLACEIWELIDSKRNREEIVNEISCRYPDVPGTVVREDILSYLDLLHQRRLISYIEEKLNGS